IGPAIVGLDARPQIIDDLGHGLVFTALRQLPPSSQPFGNQPVIVLLHGGWRLAPVGRPRAKIVVVAVQRNDTLAGSLVAAKGGRARHGHGASRKVATPVNYRVSTSASCTALPQGGKRIKRPAKVLRLMGDEGIEPPIFRV